MKARRDMYTQKLKTKKQREAYRLVMDALKPFSDESRRCILEAAMLLLAKPTEPVVARSEAWAACPCCEDAAGL